MKVEKKTSRINKFLAENLSISRRQADRLVESGEVKLNNVTAKAGDQVSHKDKVFYQDKLVTRKNKQNIYIVINKPRGIVTSTTNTQGQDIVSYLNYPERVFPIGRLDKDSEGLLILTNDGDIVNRILRAEYKHEKEYLVYVDKDIDEAFVQKMSEGVRILGQKTLPAKVSRINDRSFRIVIIQGLNRQIRRMCEALGYEVTYLKRIRMMNVTLGNLKSGEWRKMGFKELEQMEELLQKAEKNVKEDNLGNI